MPSERIKMHRYWRWLEARLHCERRQLYGWTLRPSGPRRSEGFAKLFRFRRDRSLGKDTSYWYK